MKNNASNIFIAATIAAMAVVFGASAQAGSFNYSSSINSLISFDGAGNFTFTPSANNIHVTTGSAAGLSGEITGTYAIGTITINGSQSSAPVTGTGTFVIHDGANDLTATVQWVDIFQDGTGNQLNLSGTINLTNITYAGSNTDLLALMNAGSGANVLSYQFVPAVDLTTLKNGPGSHSTTFSGTVAYQAAPPPNPCIELTKTPDTLTAPPGTPVGYTYTVENCGGVTLTNITVTDDNGTPGFPGDDFVVGTIASLAPGDSQDIHVTGIIPPIEMCMTVNGNNVDVGTLIIQQNPAGYDLGDVRVIYRQSRNVNDNVYGTPATADGWPSGHKFSDLTGSDMATFQFTDGLGNIVLKFKADYISQASSYTFPCGVNAHCAGTVSYPSGYGTLGATGGDGGTTIGSSSNVLSVKTTLTSDLNQSSAFYGYTTNSPTPESNFPTWDYVDGYDVVVSHNAFGANGFGGVTLPLVHDSPSKLGINAITPTPCGNCSTNTAHVVAFTPTGGTVTDSATATVCPNTGCQPLNACVPPYPFVSTNPLTNIAFNESTVMRAAIISTTGANCAPQSVQVFYNDEHALTLGVRQTTVRTSSGVTTTNYTVSPLTTNPGSVTNPAVGATVAQLGTDTSGRPMFPSLFITDLSVPPGNSNPLAGDWQYGGTPVPPTKVFGTWKAAAKSVDQTKNPTAVVVTPDADPAKNGWNLGPNADPVPAGLKNEGYGAEIRWDINTLGLTSGHQYRLYFMVHDGDQNKTGGDVGQACGTFTMP